MPDSMVTHDELEKMFGDVLNPENTDETLSEEERVQRARAERLRAALYPNED